MSQHKMSDPELNNDVMLYYNSWKNVTFVWILYKYGYEFHNLFLGLYQSTSSMSIYMCICLPLYSLYACLSACVLRHTCLCTVCLQAFGCLAVYVTAFTYSEWNISYQSTASQIQFNPLFPITLCFSWWWNLGLAHSYVSAVPCRMFCKHYGPLSSLNYT